MWGMAVTVSRDERVFWGRLIQKARVENVLKMDAVGSWLGVTKSVIYQWETGQRKPDIARMALLRDSRDPDAKAFADSFWRGVASAFKVEDWDRISYQLSQVVIAFGARLERRNHLKAELSSTQFERRRA